MKKNVVILLALTASLYAAPITTTLLTCTDGCSGASDTFASVNIGNMSIQVTANYTGHGSPGWITAIARATLDDDLVLTLHGGTGVGRWLPCISTSFNDSGLSSSSAWAAASFGPLAAGSGANGGSINCTDLGQLLAFETPTPFHLHLQASAYADDSLPRGAGGTASARLAGIYVEPGVSYSLVEAIAASPFNADDPSGMPEPGSVVLMGLGVGGFAGRYWRTNASRRAP